MIDLLTIHLNEEQIERAQFIRRQMRNMSICFLIAYGISLLLLPTIKRPAVFFDHAMFNNYIMPFRFVGPAYVDYIGRLVELRKNGVALYVTIVMINSAAMAVLCIFFSLRILLGSIVEYFVFVSQQQNKNINMSWAKRLMILIIYFPFMVFMFYMYTYLFNYFDMQTSTNIKAKIVFLLLPGIYPLFVMLFLFAFMQIKLLFSGFDGLLKT